MLQNLTIKQLVYRLETADDFKYDDEQVEMGRRGIKWKWDKNSFKNKVIIIN